MKFAAVAFDLDGTLYPNIRLFVRLVPFLLREQRLLRALGKARTYLRKSYESPIGTEDTPSNMPAGDFYDTQARLMAGILGEDAELVKERTERLIYRGWEPHFLKIRLFPHVKETLEAFKKMGIKMGLLSDFPPETKLKNLQIAGCWDAVCCSELSGRIKPDKKPFLDLARKMGVPPEDILYVGNSASYDVMGARGVGMKTALIRSGWKKHPRSAAPDFVFSDYRQLYDYVVS